MAKKKRGASRAASPDAPHILGAELPPLGPADAGGVPVETTGRFVVIMKEDGKNQPARVRATLRDVAGVKSMAASSDYTESAVSSADLKSNAATYFEKLGVCIVTSEDAATALAGAASDSDSQILAIEPEYIAYPSQMAGGSEYLRGYRDAVNHVYDALSGTGVTTEEAEAAAVTFQDNSQFTWGLQAVRAHTSRFTGNGIKVAVLDTGFDLAHPDYAGRPVVTRTFTGVSVQDTHGHGTHCIGTACGPARPASGARRYGVATGALIHVGRVFDNTTPRPRAPTSAVIAGIEWAVVNGCRVISLSLGIPINQKVLQYEEPTRRALNAGTLVVAAAGNNAQRPSFTGFVEPPANADAALAVAAIDRRLRIASFSARSSLVTGVGGRVNVAGPGVAVFSSVPVALGRHGFLDGTSMATPHVAGIAALWAEATGLKGAALANRLLQTAQALTLPSADVGSGLAQAPQ